MSAQSLTAKYRPQRFSEVAGQDAVKRILSRAAAEDRIAPAYLFSGTRGVGKTTLARVLAKAINCLNAPAAEPCNKCLQCDQITRGISPDVVEIDAATHGNVEEARRLKEDIGYAPLQSRYKVFIIDEAHMLSKAAFNALLKTLEEPPGRVTFILATTEPHKILPTIISRCQHYVFKRLPQHELETHLAGLLAREGIPYDAGAVGIIARRGAGSVRDSMSLLAQVLALGGDGLREEDVRNVLGLAGQDVFLALMQAFEDQDCLAVSLVLREVLDKGLDIGFFLRELATCWRNLFILGQAGEKALGSLELSEDEAGRWLEWAGRFEPRHVHACWQMTLEGQRRVMTSLEPALALELLLLNLAYLPKLLSLDNFAPTAKASAPAPKPQAPPKAPARPTEPRAAVPLAQPQASWVPVESARPSGERNWRGFHNYVTEWGRQQGRTITGLGQLSGELEGAGEAVTVRLMFLNELHRSQIDKPEVMGILRDRLIEYFGQGASLVLEEPTSAQTKSPDELKEELSREPLFQEAVRMGGHLLHVKPR